MALAWAIPARAVGRTSYASGNTPAKCTVRDEHTTNNRMELTAAIEGLRSLKEPCKVEVITDSEYLKNGITTWIHGWKRNGWKTAAKKPVVNQDLWMELEQAANGHDIQWTWTKGHANHEDNNRCDELATRAARDQQ